MKNKNLFVKGNPKQSHNLQTVRQHLRNKLIQVGLECNQSKVYSQSKRKISNKSSIQRTDNKNLPQIFSLKNSLEVSRQDNIKFAYQIFSQRDLFLCNQSNISKPGKQIQKQPQKQSNSFRQQFHKKIIEQARLYKMEQCFPSLRRSRRRQKFKTEANETILIQAIRQPKQSQVIFVTPCGKIKNARSKTEQHRAKQPSPKMIKAKTTQYKQLSPWQQETLKDNWLQQF